MTKRWLDWWWWPWKWWPPWEWWPWKWCFQKGPCLATAILIRHADVDTGAGTDPPLNGAGTARAQELRHVLGNSGITAIFVTSFQRSQQTAGPLAGDLGIMPTVINDSASVVAALQGLASSTVTLVIGHTNTLPEIGGALGVTTPAIGSTEFDNMFVACRRRLTALRYGA